LFDSVYRERMGRGHVKQTKPIFAGWGSSEPTDYSYIPKVAVRGVEQPTNPKARITAIVTVGASGNFLPLVLILKHSAPKNGSADELSKTVIRKLQVTRIHELTVFTDICFSRGAGFGQDQDWTLLTWTRRLTLRDSEKEYKVLTSTAQ
jgi:hypothetical protein